MKLYFVRHGQSEANLREDYYDDLDAHLTDLGKIQAMVAGDVLKETGEKFDAIICSPYTRAQETCRIALRRAGMLKCLVAIDDRVGERKFDGLIGQTVTPEHNREIYDYNSNRSILDGIETLEQLEERARRFINEIMENYPNGNVLVFSHGIFGLAMYVLAHGRPKSNNLCSLRLLKNGEMMVLEF